MYSKLYFFVLLEAKNTCFVTKNYSKSSYIFAFILSKKQHNWFKKNFHKSGMVGRRKLSDYRLVFALKGDTAIQQSYKIKLKKQLFIQIIKNWIHPEGRVSIESRLLPKIMWEQEVSSKKSEKNVFQILLLGKLWRILLSEIFGR